MAMNILAWILGSSQGPGAGSTVQPNKAKVAGVVFGPGDIAIPSGGGVSPAYETRPMAVGVTEYEDQYMHLIPEAVPVPGVYGAAPDSLPSMPIGGES